MDGGGGVEVWMVGGVMVGGEGGDVYMTAIISSVASRLATSTCRPKSTILHEIYGRLNLNLVCANATAILSRIAPPP